jgi:pilus assembly protein Flp/PilA
MRRLLREADAATMPEYALMVALIAIVCIGVVTTLGLNVQGAFTTIAAAIANA